MSDPNDHSRWTPVARAIDETAIVGGEIWECGAFEGDFAEEMAKYAAANRMIRVFDTFAGQPFASKVDRHKVGSMKSDFDKVTRRLAWYENVIIHPGIMPATFVGLERATISVANLDVDNEQSAAECLAWLYPRVHRGGYIFIDDYACGGGEGARNATDAFLRDKREKLVHPHHKTMSQAYFVKL